MNKHTISNYEDRLKREVKSVYDRAGKFSHTAEELDNFLTRKVLNSPIYRHIPRYVKSYIQGYTDALREIHCDKVKWVLPWDGKLYEHFVDLPPAGKEFYRQNGNTGFHVYIKDETKHFSGNREQYKTGIK